MKRKETQEEFKSNNKHKDITEAKISSAKHWILYMRWETLFAGSRWSWTENKVIEKSSFFLCRQMGNGAELWERITLTGPGVPWQRGTGLNSGFSTLLTIAPTPWRSGLSPSRSQSKGSFSDPFMLKTKSIPWGLINSSAGSLFGQTEEECLFPVCSKCHCVKVQHLDLISLEL